MSGVRLPCTNPSCSAALGVPPELVTEVGIVADTNFFRFLQSRGWTLRHEHPSVVRRTDAYDGVVHAYCGRCRNES